MMFVVILILNAVAGAMYYSQGRRRGTLDAYADAVHWMVAIDSMPDKQAMEIGVLMQSLLEEHEKACRWPLKYKSPSQTLEDTLK